MESHCPQHPSLHLRVEIRNNSIACLVRGATEQGEVELEGGARKGEWNKPDGWKVRAWPGMLKQHGVKRREDDRRREDGSVGRTIKELGTDYDGASGSTPSEVGRGAVRGRVDLAAVRMLLLLFLPTQPNWRPLASLSPPPPQMCTQIDSIEIMTPKCTPSFWLRLTFQMKIWA